LLLAMRVHFVRPIRSILRKLHDPTKKCRGSKEPEY
jgi:hypothetical protein